MKEKLQSYVALTALIVLCISLLSGYVHSEYRGR